MSVADAGSLDVVVRPVGVEPVAVLGLDGRVDEALSTSSRRTCGTTAGGRIVPRSDP